MGDPSDHFLCISYGSPNRSISLLTICGSLRLVSFILIKAPSDQFLCILYGAPLDQFLHMLNGDLHRSVSLHAVWGPLRSVSLHAI